MIETWQGFDDNVRVADEDTVIVHLSWCGVVVGLSVRECTGLQVLELEFDGELLVGWDFAKVEWEDEFGGGNLVLGDDTTLRNDIARARTDLLAISQRNARRRISMGGILDRVIGYSLLGQAEVDVVVGARERRNLAGSGSLLTVRSKAIFNDTGIKIEACLWVLVIATSVVVITVASIVVVIAITSIVIVIAVVSVVVIATVIAISTVVIVVSAIVVVVVSAIVVVSIIIGNATNNIAFGGFSTRRSNGSGLTNNKQVIRL